MYVVATAGHVDHGKSTLVRALTGMEPDRFAEERRRGMTIDLGYAWLRLPSGAELAFVDVPGHERFIANMLAGLGPAPAVLFVVAADEGWGRQSAEHLAAIDALDLRDGLLAVTRSDLADPGPARADALGHIARSSLGTVASVAVSGATGAGLDALTRALDELVAALPAPDPAARVRFWIDRRFTVRGAGTIVTGTLSAGTISVGDRLQLRDEPVTVRALQSLGRDVGHAVAPARLALNLRRVERDDIARGDALLTPDAWWWTDRLDARLTTIEDADPAGRPGSPDRLASQLVLHVGTAAVPARLRPLGASASAGADPRDGVVRLSLARPLPMQAGDRGVLRDPGRHAVAAGVLVLDADPPPLTRRGAAARRAADLKGATGVLSAEAELARRGVVRRADLLRLGAPATDLDTAGIAVGDWLVDPRHWARWLHDLPDVLAAHAAATPLDPGMPVAALRRALEIPDAALAEAVLKAADITILDGRAVAARAAPTSLGPAEAGVRAVEQALRHHPFAAPERDTLAAHGLGRRELAAAERAGRLVRVSDDIVLLPDAIERAVAVLRALPQPFPTGVARQALGTTRRVAVPLLEYLDAHGRTRRDGDQRHVV